VLTPTRTALALSLLLAAFASSAEVEFDRVIRPLFSDTCFKCHGPDEAKRKADLRLDSREGLFSAVESGDLLERITSTDPDERMPPPKSGLELSSAQINSVKTWINEGAEWKQHWSLAAPQKPAIPTVSNPDWIRNPIDAFVLSRLDGEGLKPSAAADPQILRRRLTFDLTGLPPEPDKAPTIDEMLNSKRYAERMAFRWLDAARYADTSGYQTDGWREMWRWRDWVIEAFDRNLTFDQFTIDQLAGDLRPEPSLDQLIATGFNRNHRGNAEGGSIPEEFQVEYVVDRVDSTFAVWQGLTMGCARCHNHKYDPISQRDYYAAFAFFNNIPEHGRAWKEGNSVPWIPAPTREQSQQLLKLNQMVETQQAEFAKWEPKLPDMIAKWSARVKLDPDWTLTDGEVDFEAEAEAGAKANFGYLDSFSLGAWITRKEAVAGTVISKMVPIDRESGYSLHLTETGAVQLNLVKRWLDDSLRVETKAKVPLGEPTHVFATYDGTRNSAAIRIYINGELAEHVAKLDYINQSFAAADEPVRIGKGNSDFRGEISAARIFARPLPAEDVRIVAEDGWGEHKMRRFFLEVGGPENLRVAWAKLKLVQSERDQFQQKLPSVMVMQDSAPRQTHVLMRGEYSSLGEKVEPGVPTALPPLPANAPKNRLGLAKWLVSTENPLTARVVVNRVWRDFFGVGLVKTAEDFGVQGERPSHPGLLDWLAVEFMESGWDFQHLIKLITASATYQQSSRANPDLLARDPENRLLARGPRFRLPAEMIRDQALFVSGLLSEKIGGPSVKTYQPEGLWKDIASDTDYLLASGPDLYRRSLFTYWKRTVPPPMMMNFDASSRESCEVHVHRTNTPLQALNLMNDVTFVEAARVLAAEILKTEDPLNSAFVRILGRPPAKEQRQQLLASLAFYRSEFGRDAQTAKELNLQGESKAAGLDSVELAAWTMICSTLLNLDEAVTKE
jgi:hypothetical protein